MSSLVDSVMSLADFEVPGEALVFNVSKIVSVTIRYEKRKIAWASVLDLVNDASSRRVTLEIVHVDGHKFTADLANCVWSKSRPDATKGGVP